MAGRPQIFKKEDALRDAIELFWLNGYEATSTEQLLDKMQINKGSLYHAFGNKRQLFQQAIDFFACNTLQALDRQIAAASTPITGIRNFFLGLADKNNYT